MDEPRLEGDEIAELIAVNLVYRGDDGQGPIHGVGDIRTKGIVGELVNFNADFDTFQQGDIITSLFAPLPAGFNPKKFDVPK